MPQYATREEAIDRQLIPALREIDVDPDEVDVEAIARMTVRGSQSFSHAPTWQNNAKGESLRRIAEEHRRD